MNIKIDYGKLKHILVKLSLLTASIALFVLSFPGATEDGIGIFSWIAFIPVFLICKTTKPVKSSAFGFIYGLVSYVFLVPFFNSYGIKGGISVTYIATVLSQGAYFALLFATFSKTSEKIPKYSPLLNAATYTAYCYILTSPWEMAMPYCLLPYAMYKQSVLIQIVDIAGIFGLAFILAFSQNLIAILIIDKNPKAFMKNHLAWLCGGLIVFQIVYGIICLSIWENKTPEITLSIGIIQHNGANGIWETAKERYTDIKADIENLAEQDPDLIVTAENSFYPPIEWFLEYPISKDENASSLDFQTYTNLLALEDMTNDLLKLSRTIKIPVYIGNVATTLDEGYDAYPDGFTDKYKAYTQAILLEDGHISETYSKIHLAPFDESFPMDTIPFLYNFYKSLGVHSLSRGSEYTVFDVKGSKIATPICFEDAFAHVCSKFNSDLFIGMGSDFYDKTGIGQKNHAIISLFKAVENRVEFLKVYNSGLSCLISPTGKIEKTLPQLIHITDIWEVPVYESPRTFYEFFPDWSGILNLLITICLVIYLIKNKEK